MFTIAYTFKEFLGTELGSWLVSTGGILVTAFLSILVSKIRAKAAIIAAKDEQLTELSSLVLRLSTTIEKLGQMFTLAFMSSKGLTEATKLAITNLAKEIVTDVKSDAYKLIELALDSGKNAMAKQAQVLLKAAEDKANSIIDGLELKSTPLNVDDLT